jgi:DNA-binding transcriptional LysR family regulator
VTTWRSASDPSQEFDWISWDESLGFLPEARWVEQLGVTPRLRCNRMHSIIAALRAGVGVGVPGRQLAACFPECVERPVPELAAHSTALWLVRPTVHRNNALVSLVSAWIEDLFTE